MKNCSWALAAMVGVLAMLSASATGENWAQWRGPNFNGSTTETNLPTKFSTTENVVWKAKLPGVGGGRIWPEPRGGALIPEKIVQLGDVA